MIGFLQGEVIQSDGTQTILLTSSGIGYEVYLNLFVNKGEKIKLFISHIIREADQTLFGFQNFNDKKIFELLLSVNGVGPKSAYSLICSLGSDGLITAISLEDTKSLKTAQGIGKKAADQLVLSLKDKISKIIMDNNDAPKIKTDSLSESIEDKNINKHIVQETMLALESLGYKDSDILPLIKKNIEGMSTSEDLIKSVLREL